MNDMTGLSQSIMRLITGIKVDEAEISWKSWFASMDPRSHVYLQRTVYFSQILLKCIADLISHQTPQGALPLCGDPSSNTGGPNFARLGDNNVARRIFLTVVVQNKLRHQGGLATTRGSSNNHYRVIFYERNKLGGGKHTHTHKCIHTHNTIRDALLKPPWGYLCHIL